MFLNNNWILLEFLKTFIKVYVRQVFVNVRRNFIFSGHHVRQILKKFLQPCRLKILPIALAARNFRRVPSSRSNKKNRRWNLNIMKFCHTATLFLRVSFIFALFLFLFSSLGSPVILFMVAVPILSFSSSFWNDKIDVIDLTYWETIRTSFLLTGSPSRTSSNIALLLLPLIAPDGGST